MRVFSACTHGIRYHELKGQTPLGSQVTNWASFSECLDLVGGEQTLHLPLYEISAMPFDCEIIFRPNKSELAVMYFAKTVTHEQLLKDAPLGANVSVQIFRQHITFLV